ncbi:MAG TPA: hypothetical protein IAB27_03935 [Candidatus Coprosoma intestinipullorum]|uniref:Uncharacterized protein n=1 Tax=Candidatus Coprosoma intestinipullorum TaxID=2840752 RepID=A0A9D0ZR78_9FIRM|nr:hypothetical protein [Candidatus Coprosoma intestinipullorum]
MTNYNLEESELLKWQLLLTFIFIGTLLVSLTITYNEILKMEDKEPLYNEDVELAILRTNRLIALTVSLGFLLINVRDKNLKLLYNQDNLEDADKQIIAGILSVVAAIIVLGTATTGSTENPED